MISAPAPVSAIRCKMPGVESRMPEASMTGLSRSSPAREIRRFAIVSIRSDQSGVEGVVSGCGMVVDGRYIQSVLYVFPLADGGYA